MKKCIKCNQIYSDDTLNYCLNDGTTLVFEGEQETVVMQKTPLPKKGKTLLWVGIIGLLVFGGIGLVGAYMLYNYFTPKNNLTAQNQNTATVSPSPKVSSTVKTTPTIKTDSTPKSEEVTDTSDEFTPINWRTNAYQFKGENGQTLKFKCPPNGTAEMVWGSDVYTADSSICTAAVHAGLFTLEDGGEVTVEYRPGRQTYGSTERNGITTYNYSEFDRSFVVR